MMMSSIVKLDIHYIPHSDTKQPVQGLNIFDLLLLRSVHKKQAVFPSSLREYRLLLFRLNVELVKLGSNLRFHTNLTDCLTPGKLAIPTHLPLSSSQSPLAGSYPLPSRCFEIIEYLMNRLISFDKILRQMDIIKPCNH